MEPTIVRDNDQKAGSVSDFLSRNLWEIALKAYLYRKRRKVFNLEHGVFLSWIEVIECFEEGKDSENKRIWKFFNEWKEFDLSITLA